MAPLHIVPAGTTDLEEALAWPGSKVLMKSGEEYGRALQMLRDKGLDDRAALAVNCGLPEEMLCATLRAHLRAAAISPRFWCRPTQMTHRHKQERRKRTWCILWVPAPARRI